MPSRSNKSEEYIKVCKQEDIPERGGIEIMVYDYEIALFRVEGKIYAINNLCPHHHSPILHEGFIEQCAVVCPAHGWKFSLKTGKQPGNKAGVSTYPVKCEGDDVLVSLPKAKYSF